MVCPGERPMCICILSLRIWGLIKEGWIMVVRWPWCRVSILGSIWTWFHERGRASEQKAFQRQGPPSKRGREEVNSHGCRAVSAQWGFCTRPAGIRAHALVLSKKHSPTPGWPVRSLATETACAAHGKEEDPDSALGQPVGRSGTGNVCNGPGSYGAFPEFQRINWTIEVRKSRKQRKIVKQDKIKIL